MIEPVKRSNIGDLIVNQIKGLILEGKLKPGDRLLPERELMDMFQVGRTSLREGLKVLESQGLVERSQKGTFISKNYHQFLSDSLMYQIVLADTELEDLFEARRVIEKELAYLAALRASEEDLLTIAKTVEGMEKAIEARDKKEYAMMDMHFHESIAKASKNLVMCEIYYSIKNLVFRAVNKAGIINESLAFHKKIFEAIQQRRADEASELMLAHMKSVYAHLKDDGNK